MAPAPICWSPTLPIGFYDVRIPEQRLYIKTTDGNDKIALVPTGRSKQYNGGDVVGGIAPGILAGDARNIMKICSLLPSGTEIAYALGLGDQVVGVTDLCDYPPEAKSKHVVSRGLVDSSVLTSAEVEQKMKELAAAGESTFEIDTDWLYRESPDLILTQDLCYVCDVDSSQVFEAVGGFRTQPKVLVLSPRTVSEVFTSIMEVGQAAGVSAEAHQLVELLRARVEKVEREASTAGYSPKVFSLEGVDPLVAGGHWIPEMKVLAGGRDEMFSPGCPALRLSWDHVLNYDPEFLFLTLCSSGLERSLREVHWLERQEGWWDLLAVRTGQVYMIDHVYYSRPGPRIVPRIVEGIEILPPRLFIPKVLPTSYPLTRC